MYDHVIGYVNIHLTDHVAGYMIGHMTGHVNGHKTGHVNGLVSSHVIDSPHTNRPPNPTKLGSHTKKLWSFDLSCDWSCDWSNVFFLKLQSCNRSYD